MTSLFNMRSFRIMILVLCILSLFTLLPILQPSASARTLVPIPEEATTGPVPNPACYGSVSLDNAWEVLDVIQQARDSGLLTADEAVAFDPNANFYRGLYSRDIEYYLDDTILAILWKEEIDGKSCSFA